MACPRTARNAENAYPGDGGAYNLSFWIQRPGEESELDNFVGFNQDIWFHHKAVIVPHFKFISKSCNVTGKGALQAGDIN